MQYFDQQANQDDGSCIYFGCTNNLAVNFDSNATQDDESCIIFGCTLDLYPNYNPAATLEDFSCDRLVRYIWLYRY